MNTIDKILLGLALFMAAFAITMVVLFCIFQAIPDTLVEVFGQICCSEALITFAIWWIKKQYGKDTKK